MAEKNLQMRRKLAGGGFDDYFPITKAANVMMPDGGTILDTAFNKITVDTSGITDRIRFQLDDRIVKLNYSDEDIYNLGTDYVNLVEGYSFATGSQAKNADHLLLTLGSWANTERGYETPLTDLTNVNSIEMEFETTLNMVGGNPNGLKSAIVVTTSTGIAYGSVTIKAEDLGTSPRVVIKLDTSTLTGSYYISARLFLNTSGVTSVDARMKVYRITLN